MSKLIASLLIGISGATGATSTGPRVAAVNPAETGRAAPRLFCGHPDALALVRFEDGSARLDCGRRLLVRVAVPW